MNSSTSNGILDVAIVGAGVSGVYSGWRMLRERRGAAGKSAAPKITIFEGSDRIGGRLLSLTPPGMPKTRCELGGMRYMSRHVLVAWLVQNFKLPTEPMPVGDPANIAYLRGHQVRLADLNTPSLLPYNFTPIEERVVEDPNTALLLYALQQIVPNSLAITYEQLLEEMQTATFDGKPLHEQGFWNVMARVLSPDAYWFVRDTSGYDCLVSNWSAADAIPFILADFGQGVTYSRFPDGYDQLPQRLAAEFEAGGGKIKLNTRLKSFDSAKLPDGTDGVVLKLSDGTTVHARNLVLAMPRRSLELMEPTGSILDPRHTDVRDLIESVMPIPLFKIFLCYDYPWWKAIGVNAGRSLTDMPIRQCYYWGVEPRSPIMDGNSCLLASYDDDLSVTFWAGLRAKTAQTPLYEPRRHFSGKLAASQDWPDHRAPKAMVEEAHRQIQQMHGVTYAPKPYDAAYRDWAEDPYGGGVNFWQIHAKSWEVIPAIVNPRKGIPVYICGEAYSHEQGWVEGALQTAEIMLQKHFKLPPPPAMQPPKKATGRPVTVSVVAKNA
ncbi:MAG: amine oxidase [Betaproteobacteria bacterium]|nr:amine oxidase [Betaproteobacteria bacterium]